MIEIDFIDLLDRFNLALKKNSTEIREGEQNSASTGQGMIFEDHKNTFPAMTSGRWTGRPMLVPMNTTSKDSSRKKHYTSHTGRSFEFNGLWRA